MPYHSHIQVKDKLCTPVTNAEIDKAKDPASAFPGSNTLISGQIRKYAHTNIFFNVGVTENFVIQCAIVMVVMLAYTRHSTFVCIECHQPFVAQACKFVSS